MHDLTGVSWPWWPPLWIWNSAFWYPSSLSNHDPLRCIATPLYFNHDALSELEHGCVVTESVSHPALTRTGEGGDERDTSRKEICRQVCVQLVKRGDRL